MTTSSKGRRYAGVAAGLVVALLTGCAGVSFYSDPTLKDKTGIPIYGAKPYVLVARTKAKDKPVEVSIQYLTDYSRVIYAKPRSGFGSSDLKLSLSNGQLTQFGQATDTKIPELIAAVSGLLTSRGNAEKALAEADSIRSKIGTTQSAKIPDAETLKAIKSLLADMTEPAAKTDIAKLDKTEQAILANVVHALSNIASAVDDPSKVNLVPGYGDGLIAAAKQFSDLPADPAASSARATALQRIRDWKPRLADIVAKLTPEEAAPAGDFELYEIQQSANGVILRRVR